jgi:rare lipoprotein A (peptidoglycan hydrolase)
MGGSGTGGSGTTSTGSGTTTPGSASPLALVSGPATSPLSVTVYKTAVATYYGPGFFGHRTACGQMLRRNTLGVANLTLKCGTLVQIYYNGEMITVPVIDRGPYAHGVGWDLTEATAKALGILETVTIGTVPLPFHAR